MLRNSMGTMLCAEPRAADEEKWVLALGPFVSTPWSLAPSLPPPVRSVKSHVFNSQLPSQEVSQGAFPALPPHTSGHSRETQGLRPSRTGLPFEAGQDKPAAGEGGDEKQG